MTAYDIKQFFKWVTTVKFISTPDFLFVFNQILARLANSRCAVFSAVCDLKGFKQLKWRSSSLIVHSAR